MAVHLTPKKALNRFKRAEREITLALNSQLPPDIKLSGQMLLKQTRDLSMTAESKNANYRELKGQNGGQL